MARHDSQAFRSRQQECREKSENTDLANAPITSNGNLVLPQKVQTEAAAVRTSINLCQHSREFSQPLPDINHAHHKVPFRKILAHKTPG